MSKVMIAVKPEPRFRTGGHLIDCSAKPFIPKGLVLASHEKGDAFYFWDKNAQGRELWQASGQNQRSRCLSGHTVLKKLGRREAMNASALDTLLIQPDLMPEEWEEIYVFFPRTIFRNPSTGYLYVRYAYRGSGRNWRSDIKCLSYAWPSNYYMALSLE